ncbi:MAG TPA: sigma-54-dependent Fis family transcriptional regulator [Methylococcaceae bacterium]|nr:sigma-54-dependent Fis family transcriptional regulator [Methylococcaceae bacterium]
MPLTTPPQRLFDQWLLQHRDNRFILSLLKAFETSHFLLLDQQQIILYSNATTAHLLRPINKHLIGTICPTELFNPSVTDTEPKTILLNNTPFILETHALLTATQQKIGHLLVLSEHPSTPDNTFPPTDIATAEMNFHGILSQSSKMKPVFQIIENAARTDSTVLVRGDSGSGKELVAKAIHALSSRNKQPFLAINCATLSANLLESELFGHVKGAFTGAVNNHIGLFQRAHKGTLFLDEIAELPLELQAKLLRVIQERTLTPVGGTQSVTIDVRLVAATHHSLRERVTHGLFRADLMYRLRVVPIFIPSLKERREDIQLLLWHFTKQNNLKKFRIISKISPKAMQALLNHSWPGNIRELQNVLEYAFVVGQGSTLHYSELPPEFKTTQENLPPTPNIHFSGALTVEQERTAIQNALTQYRGKINPAAESLGMSRATFWRKRKQHEL